MVDLKANKKWNYPVQKSKMSPSPEGQEKWSSPEACYKGRISGPAPKLLNQNLHFNRISEIHGHTEVWNTQVSNLPFQEVIPNLFSKVVVPTYIPQ